MDAVVDAAGTVGGLTQFGRLVERPMSQAASDRPATFEGLAAVDSSLP